MNTLKRLIIPVLMSSVILAGCSTPHATTKWDYKTTIVNTGSGGSDEVDKVLNRFAQEGWSVVSFSRTAEGGNYTWAFVLKHTK